MRHRNLTAKLGRKDAHRDALIANIVTSLIASGHVVTTYRIARLARRFADRMITLAKAKTLHARRQAISFLRPSGQAARDIVRKLFDELGPRYAERKGGYTSVIKLAPRRGDRAPMAVMQYVGTELKVRVRSTREKETELEVDTEVAPGSQVAEAEKKPEQKQDKAEQKAEPKPEHPRKKDHHKAADKSDKAPDKRDKKDETKDRKGGFLRFISRLWHPDGGKK